MALSTGHRAPPPALLPVWWKALPHTVQTPSPDFLPTHWPHQKIPHRWREERDTYSAPWQQYHARENCLCYGLLFCLREAPTKEKAEKGGTLPAGDRVILHPCRTGSKQPVFPGRKKGGVSVGTQQ